MKKLVVVCTLIVLTCMGCMQEEAPKTTVLQHLTPYAPDPEFLNGQLKSLSQFVYWAIEEDGSYVKGESITQKERDSLKFMIDFKVFYDENGIHQRTDYYSYERKINFWITDIEDGKMVKSTWTWNDTSRYYFIYEYDENKHFIAGKGYRPLVDTLVNQIQLTVNADGYITSNTTYDEDNNRGRKYVFEYTEDNLVTSEKTYSKTDSLLSLLLFSYDENGLGIREEHQDGLGESSRIFTTEYTKYDDMGNWLLDVTRDDKGLVVVQERVYEYY